MGEIKVVRNTEVIYDCLCNLIVVNGGILIGVCPLAVGSDKAVFNIVDAVLILCNDGSKLLNML